MSHVLVKKPVEVKMSPFSTRSVKLKKYLVLKKYLSALNILKQKKKLSALNIQPHPVQM